MKIIATIGPCSKDKMVLREFINGGVDIIRLNFSHFNEEEFKDIIKIVKSINDKILIMADLCGNKVRVYEGLKKTYKIYHGDEVFFCGSDVYELLVDYDSKTKIIPLSINTNILEKSNIENISIKDGTINFDIIDKNKGFIKAKVIDEGVIRAGKGCNIRTLHRSELKLNHKDKKDIEWAIKNKVDILCQSYVETSTDILEVKEYVNYIGNYNLKYYAKIETKFGIDNCNEIINSVDGIVIGRGDLVPECGLIQSVIEEYIAIEKLKGISKSKDIIIATHILENMRNSKVPTLPEVEAIYNFIKKGVNGFMLASETSVSKSPLEAIKMLKEITNKYITK